MSQLAIAPHNRLKSVKKPQDIDHNVNVLIRAMSPLGLRNFPKEISDGTRLRQDLGLKDVILATFFDELEKVFQCTLPASARRRIATVGGLVREIRFFISQSQPSHK